MKVPLSDVFCEIEANLKRTLVFCFALCCTVLAQTGQPPITADQPKDVSITNIINSFAAKEKNFKQALEQYTYTRDVTISAKCQDGQVGVYHLKIDVTFDKNSNRLENIQALSSTLTCIFITKNDLDTFRNQSLFLLTTDEIQNYRINFVGQQKTDKANFYVFDVSPSSALTGKPCFDGRIWVDARDFSLVGTQGTVSTKRKEKRKGDENIVPTITTLRGQIDGQYWFPTQSRAKDVLHFSSGDVQIDEVVNFTDYKPIAHPK